MGSSGEGWMGYSPCACGYASVAISDKNQTTFVRASATVLATVEAPLGKLRGPNPDRS
jgi:hypothetical protein